MAEEKRRYQQQKYSKFDEEELLWDFIREKQLEQEYYNWRFELIE